MPERRSLILVVDDDLRTTRILVKMLREDGFDVDHATHGAAAIGRLTRGPLPDALLTDFRMPYADGFTVARFGRFQRPLLPIMMMTGYPEQMTQADRAMDPPPVIFTKPVDYAVIHAELRRMVGRADEAAPSSRR
jgi:CheY-like chemotaxis protein